MSNWAADCAGIGGDEDGGMLRLRGPDCGSESQDSMSRSGGDVPAPISFMLARVDVT